jgi:O-succinylbenzoic acid--CoA ligase
MTRALRVIAGDAAAILPGLSRALEGGDAILPIPPSAAEADVPVEVDSRIALVVQTSGSTGDAKRVALSRDALVASAEAAEAALGGPGQWLLAVPAHYIAGINVLVRSLVAGTDPVIVATAHTDPVAFATASAALDNPRRFVSLVPAQLSKLMEHPAALDALRRFDRILVGGQSLPGIVANRSRELGLSITRTYGSSETSGGCVYDGVPIGDTVMRVMDGEVELGGSTLAEGYLDDLDRTQQAFHTDDAGRWYRTSDAGRIVGGVLTVTGRVDDTIISGGIKVALSAVERVVRSLPGLADAIVVRRADERWGEVPVVVATASASLAFVRKEVGSKLGAAARPAEIVLVDAIPLLDSGKPDRVALEHR